MVHANTSKMQATLLLVICMLSGFTAMPHHSQAQAQAQHASSTIRISINGNMLSPEDGIAEWREGRLFLPMRVISEKLGATLQWQNESLQMDVFYGDQQVSWSAKHPYEAIVNGQKLVLDIPPFLESGRLMAPIRWTSETLGWTVEWLPRQRTVYIRDSHGQLPVVGSFNNLKQLLEQFDSNISPYRTPMITTMQETEQASASSDASGSAKGNYSETNIQVAGVDEADIVKTDGRFLYHLNPQRLAIAQAQPADAMRWMSITSYDSSGFRPKEMYLAKDQLVVIGSHAYTSDHRPASPQLNMVMPQLRHDQNTIVHIYDIADRSQPKLIRELEIAGSYLTSRMIDSQIYLIAQQQIDRYSIMESEASQVLPGPAYADRAGGDLKQDKTADTYRYIDYDQIHYFPEHPTDSYLLIGSFDLAQPQQQLQVDAYLGNGEQLYASTDHLYIAAMTDSQSVMPMRTAVEKTAEASKAQPRLPVVEIPAYPAEETTIYKFALHGGKTVFINSGRVPGRLLNQFAMDEHQGNLRLVTTTEPFGSFDNQRSKNHLFVLDPNMKQQGSVTDIAPGERIYSARFMGDRGYMVTFRTVDPLFVLDLADPLNPSILGELKIPGFSDYLHPLDENHLIGIGRNTVEVGFKNRDGSESITAYEMGMKLSLFDVTDAARPQEIFSEMIGDRGTFSEVLRNHKALLFSADKQLLTFPLTVMKTDEQEPYLYDRIPAYGSFAFQGAYVYQVDAQNGFLLRGAITHMSPEERQKMGLYHYGSESDIQRLLYIGDTLYSISNDQIRATSLDSLSLTGILPVKAP